MKILTFKPNEKVPLIRTCMVRGFAIEPKEPFKLPPDDPISIPGNNFNFVMQEREYIIQNFPLALADRRYVFTSHMESAVFKYVRPFVLRGGTLLKFESKIDCDFLLYVNFIKDEDVDKYIQQKQIDSLEPTRIKCESIPTNSLLGLISIENDARLISIGFGIPLSAQPTIPEPRWWSVSIGAGEGEWLYYPRAMQPDIRGRITLSGSKYEFWDASFRPFSLLIGDIQEGRRHVLKGVIVNPGKGKVFKRFDIIQISLERSINDLNATRPETKYGELHVIVEYVFI
jgi:hypothetical protein